MLVLLRNKASLSSYAINVRSRMFINSNSRYCYLNFSEKEIVIMILAYRYVIICAIGRFRCAPLLYRSTSGCFFGRVLVDEFILASLIYIFNLLSRK